MRQFTEKLEKIRKLHLVLLNQVSENNYKVLGKVKQTSLQLLLFSCNYKCEKCGSDERLTVHHLIGKKLKEWMDIIKYIKQRHYYANQVILCTRCHHGMHNVKPDSLMCRPIHRSKIQKIKEYLEYNEKNI